MIQQKNEAKRKRRKFLLVAPLFIWPFLTFLLWSIGVIGSPKESQEDSSNGALNTSLPEADAKKDKLIDKMGVYRKVDKDSAKYREALKSDPYLRNKYLDTSANPSVLRFSYDPSPYDGYSVADGNEQKINKKLRELNAALNSAGTANKKTTNVYDESYRNEASRLNSTDVQRLEKMLVSIADKDSTDDPEIKQLNQVMDKLLDIQHPARVEEKLKIDADKKIADISPVFVPNKSVVNFFGTKGLENTISQTDTAFIEESEVAGFFSLEEQTNTSTEDKGISAEATTTQILVSGATVKLKLNQEVLVKGKLIPKETLIFGKAVLNGERLQVRISGIRYGNSVLPVSLNAYDLDGIQGIYIPGAITGDALKQSGDQALQTMGITSIDQSIAVQAAGAGVEAAKNLLSRKIKLVKVTVKDGYKVLLKSK